MSGGPASYSGREVGVVGLGLSGLACAKALRAAGASVFVYDDNPAGLAKAAGEGFPPGRIEDVPGLAALVLSPGVPLTHPEPHPLVRAARAHGVRITGDVQLFRDGPGATARLVGITGTNGKSTTTALIAHLLRAAGVEAEAGGNIGVPVFGMDAHSLQDKTLVLELSSYQLDLCEDLRADAGVLLNVAPDHLDRHGGMEGYVRAKRRLLDQTAGFAVIGVDDKHSRALHDELRAAGRRVFAVSGHRPVEGGVFASDDGALFDATGGEPVLAADLAAVASLPGRHNRQNAAAAYATLRGLGLPPDEAARGFAGFPGLAHRSELVARIERPQGPVLLVNDSKATNTDAAARSLSSFEVIHWIAGGRPKPGGFKDLLPYLGAVRRAYLIGEGQDALERDLSGTLPIVRSGTLERAFEQALIGAMAERAPATVLLAPACASFDQFASFEARGLAFRALAIDAAKGEGKGA